jgi:arginyl-tRNA synthetase
LNLNLANKEHIGLIPNMDFSQLLITLQKLHPQLLWSLPPEGKVGILATNTFALAKEQNTNPVLLAQELNQIIKNDLPEVATSCTGPYINIDFEETLWNTIMLKNFTQPHIVQSKDIVILDYVGANVAKELHAGHMRNLNIGDAIRRLLTLTYPNLLTDNHWGDWGVNMGIILWGWKEIGQQQAFEKNAIHELTRVYVWANQQKDIVSDWDTLVRIEFKKLEDKDPINTTLWKTFIAATKNSLQTELDLFRVPKLDLDQGESFYETDMKALAELMDTHNLWNKEGLARFIDFEEIAQKIVNVDDEIRAQIAHFGRGYLISSHGYTTYLFRDVAARWQWSRDHQASRMITVTDKTQKHNFDQAFATICWLCEQEVFQAINDDDTIKRIQWNTLNYIGYGFLQLKEGKMSSRKGNVFSLRQLYGKVEEQARIVLEQKGSKIEKEKVRNISLAALKWYDLNRTPQEDIILDIPKILQFEGNTGVYQLYTVARLQSIVDKNSKSSTFQWSSLNSAEQDLCRQLVMFEYELQRSIRDLKPSIICTVLYRYASALNSWYNTCNVSQETNPVRQASLLILIQKSIQNNIFYLNLLGIESVSNL